MRIEIAEGVEIISIHAPTQGATDPTGDGSNPSSISIHAPTQGAT